MGDKYTVKSDLSVAAKHATAIGSANNPPFPAISGMAEVFPVITGVPHAIASSMGIPKLSLREVYRKTKAPLYKYAKSLLEM